jgi:hypothetical protein
LVALGGRDEHSLPISAVASHRLAPEIAAIELEEVEREQNALRVLCGRRGAGD